jgi:hypothetical protein
MAVAMYCPQCAAMTDREQSFCRHCGQQLAGVVLALEGSVEDAVGSVRLAEERINAGVATLVIFAVIGLLIAVTGFLLGEPALTLSVAIDLALGLGIGLPLLIRGRSLLRRAALLSEKLPGQSGRSLMPGTSTRPSLPDADSRHGAQLRSAPSITEGTTLNLEERDGEGARDTK